MLVAPAISKVRPVEASAPRLVAPPPAGPRRSPPSLAEKAMLGLLAVTVLALAAHLPDPAAVTLLLAHAGMLAGFAGVVWLVGRHPQARWAEPARFVSVAALVIVLYESVGYAGFVAVPWTADAALAAADRALCGGVSPALVAARHVGPRAIELWSLVYAGYLPYLYASLLFGALARPRGERRAFLDGLALTYAVSYLGYLLLPSHGPVVQHAAELPYLQGGTYLRLIESATASTGGCHGAFPSLHVGATTFLLLFDLRRDRLRALVYAPLVLLIPLATVFVRYHYVVDLLAGAAIAVLAERLTRAGRAT